MCEHNGLLRIVLTRCDSHGGPGAAMWTWSPTPPTGSCPCETADRFVVADETAAPEWLRRADVVIARERRTPSAARRAAAGLARRLPGCALVVVPVAGGTVLLRDRHGQVVASEACAICVYPWLAAGGRLAELPDPPTGQAG